VNRISELIEKKLTVGKIYAGLLISENWKAFKSTGKAAGKNGLKVSIG